MKKTLKDFNNWISILAVPTETFRNLEDRWLIASIASAIVFGCSESFLITLEQQVINNVVSQSFGDAAPANRAYTLRWEWQLLSVVWRETGMLLRWVIIAGTVFFLSLAVHGGASISFKTSFSLIVHAEVVFAFMALISVLYAHTLPIDEVLRPTDLRISISLNSLLDNSSTGSILGQIAAKLNLFSLWFVAVLGLGLSAVGGFDRFRGTIIAAASWVAWMTVSIIPSLIGFVFSK